MPYETPSMREASFGVRLRLFGLGLRFVSVVLVLVCMRPLLRVKRALVCGYGFMGKDCACPSVVLVLVCSLPDVGLRIQLLGMVSLVSPWS